MFKNFFRKIGDFVGDVLGGIGNIVSGIIGGVVKLVTNVVDGFLGAFGFSFDMPEYENPSSFQTENQGILLNNQSAVKGLPVVYGERRIGSTRVYMGVGGTNSEYLYVILAVAEGEIDGFTKIFIDDEEQEVLNAGNSARGADNKITEQVQLTVASKTPQGEDSSYYKEGRSLCVLTFYPGTETQSVNSMFRDAAPGWGQNGRLRGVAYVAARFEFINTATTPSPWQGVPEIKVEVRGKKVLQAYSSKDTNTNTSTYEADVSSMVYSNNPADCLLDYLRNPRYGKGLADNRINFTSFSDLRSIFNNTAVLSSNPTVITELVRCDAVINTEDTMFNNTKRLLQSCRGFLPYVNGKYRLKFEGGYDSSSSQFTGENPADAIEITDDMIIGEIAVQSEDKNAKYNEAQVTFANAAKEYESDTVIYKDANYIAEDGEPLILTTSHPTLTNFYRVQQYAKYLVDRSRNQLAVSIKITNEGQSIVAGDLVRITHQYNTALGGTNITDYLFKAPTTTSKTASLTAPEMLFRVVSTKLNYDNTVDLQLMEHRNEIFTVSAINVVAPPQCPPNYIFVEGKGCVYNGSGPPPTCPPGQHYDENKQNDDGTIGGCVPDNPQQCGPGFTWDPSANGGQGACVPVVTPTKVVSVRAYQNNGIGYVQFIVDPSVFSDSNRSYTILQYSLRNDGSRIAQILSGIGVDGRINVTRTDISGDGDIIRPGAVVYYKVFYVSTGQTPAERIDQGTRGQDDFQWSKITVPFGDQTIITAAATGGLSPGTQDVAGEGGGPLSIDDVNTSTAQTGFD